MKFEVNYIKNGIKDILFPHVCEICGHQLPETYSFVCESCLNTRFEEAQFTEQPFNDSGLMLPEGIEFIFSMWKFDKGGYLQDLLHNLKYHHLNGVGVDLGKQLGRELFKKTGLAKNTDILMVPVPLHEKKEWKRGFNQARAISKGIQIVTGYDVIDNRMVTRIKNTKTQTGFTLKKRNENIKNAFLIVNNASVVGKTCLVIDDVFTTGATTFELSKALRSNGAAKIIIATVACA